MSTGYQIVNQDALHFVTFTVVDWVDVFTRKSYRDILIDAFRYYQTERGLQVYGYVVMTNHLHALLRQPEGSLSDTIRDWKKYTARMIVKAVQQEPESRREWILHRFSWSASLRRNVADHQVWQHASHAEEIWTKKFLDQKQSYIHLNPVRAGWVDRPEDWRYSSASDLVRTTPLLSISIWE